MQDDARRILDAPDASLVRAKAPKAWGEVFLRPMSAADRDAFEGEQIELADAAKRAGRSEVAATAKDLRARLLVRCLCRADGTLFYGPEDVAALGRNPAGVLDPIYRQASKLNALGVAEVEALAGESGAVPSGASPTA